MRTSLWGASPPNPPGLAALERKLTNYDLMLTITLAVERGEEPEFRIPASPSVKEDSILGDNDDLIK